MLILLQLVTCDRLGESIHFPSPLGFELVYEAYHSIAIFNLSTIIFYFWKFISYIYRIIKAACKSPSSVGDRDYRPNPTKKGRYASSPLL